MQKIRKIVFNLAWNWFQFPTHILQRSSILKVTQNSYIQTQSKLFIQKIQKQNLHHFLTNNLRMRNETQLSSLNPTYLLHNKKNSKIKKISCNFAKTNLRPIKHFQMNNFTGRFSPFKSFFPFYFPWNIVENNVVR